MSFSLENGQQYLLAQMPLRAIQTVRHREVA
jgi:hypothetical protein